jgi:hypothetical protein
MSWLSILSTARQSHWVEAAIWITGLTLVCLADPTKNSEVELCVFKIMGFSGCPGCGLGHALGFLARGELLLAVKSHWMSPAVAVILLTRIGGLVFRKSSV